MQITNEKPQLDEVIYAQVKVDGHEIKHKDRYEDTLEIESCFRESETVNSETQNQIVTDLTAESCLCPIVRVDWDREQ
jgi:hypothetical protein